MRAAIAILALVAILALTMGGFTGTHTTKAIESDGPPSNTARPWTRNLDRQSFVYNDSQSVWLGELWRVDFSRAALGHSGTLKCVHGIDCDTTAANRIGVYVHDNHVLTSVRISCSNTAASSPACTLAILQGLPTSGDVDTLMLIPWAGRRQFDSTGLTVAVDSANVLMAYIWTSATDPNNPIAWLDLHEKVAP